MLNPNNSDHRKGKLQAIVVSNSLGSLPSSEGKNSRSRLNLAGRTNPANSGPSLPDIAKEKGETPR